jgi:hypothetical protein
MLAQRCGIEEIAAELRVRWGFAPRAAYRHANRGTPELTGRSTVAPVRMPPGSLRASRPAPQRGHARRSGSDAAVFLPCLLRRMR